MIAQDFIDFLYDSIEDKIRYQPVTYKSKYAKRARKLGWKHLEPKTQPKKTKRRKEND